MSTYPLPKMELLDLGIAYEHNHPCCICREKHSVLDLSRGVMEPCWNCQKAGYKVVKIEKPFIVKMWEKLNFKPNGNKWKP